MDITNNSFGLLIILAVVGFLPIISVTMTAYAKIAIVLFIVRNALGIQQLPPNIVLNALATILAAYIAYPIILEAYTSVRDAGLTFQTFADYEEAVTRAVMPLKAFLLKHTDQKQLAFFLQSTNKLWGVDRAFEASQNDLPIIVPAFVLSELTKAFEIGFLLYLPFMAIDIIVTTVLMALGMMQISPVTIAVPFKLMLFVFIDGWTKVVQGLILSYV